MKLPGMEDAVLDISFFDMRCAEAGLCCRYASSQIVFQCRFLSGARRIPTAAVSCFTVRGLRLLPNSFTVEFYLNICHESFIDFFIFLAHILSLLFCVVEVFLHTSPAIRLSLSVYLSAYLQVYWGNSVVLVLYQIHLLKKCSESALYKTVSVLLFI